tara:strand:+ start:563 stop:667 length:105 start_codon:yes stop_codon:yes gene_type:complete
MEIKVTPGKRGRVKANKLIKQIKNQIQPKQTKKI